MNIKEARQVGSHPIRMVVDGIVTAEPCLLSCIMLTVSTNGDYIEVYDGQSDDARLVMTLKCQANRTVPFLAIPGALFERGIYVTFSATDSDATFFITPVTEEV